MDAATDPIGFRLQNWRLLCFIPSLSLSIYFNSLVFQLAYIGRLNKRSSFELNTFSAKRTESESQSQSGRKSSIGPSTRGAQGWLKRSSGRMIWAHWNHSSTDHTQKKRDQSVSLNLLFGDDPFSIEGRFDCRFYYYDTVDWRPSDEALSSTRLISVGDCTRFNSIRICEKNITDITSLIIAIIIGVIIVVSSSLSFRQLLNM